MTNNNNNNNNIKTINLSRRKHSHSHSRSRIGGEVLDAGGQGCVFRPALQCVNSNKKYEGISKLGLTRTIKREWDSLQMILKYLKKIPNYQKYFLLTNLEICKPAQLTHADKQNFQICSTFDDINVNNINDNLDKFDIINMPYGGINLTDIIETNTIDISETSLLLINLLTNALVPMNRLNLYHSDLKSSNILYKNNNIKIIDFGALVVYTRDDENSMKLLNNPIQFNSPLSRIMLSPYFDMYLLQYLTQIPMRGLSSKELLKQFKKLIANYYYKFKQIIKVGHDDYLSEEIIPSVYKFLPKNNKPVKADLLFVISEYCAPILLKYVNLNTGTFNRQKYINDVYLKNMDIYGLVMCFLPYINISFSSQMKTSIAKMINKYCFSSKYAAIPININELIYDIVNITSKKFKSRKSRKSRNSRKSKRSRKSKKSKK